LKENNNKNMEILEILEEKAKQQKTIKLLMDLKKRKEDELKQIRMELRKLIQR
jgi:hypothetical protein